MFADNEVHTSNLIFDELLNLIIIKNMYIVIGACWFGIFIDKIFIYLNYNSYVFIIKSNILI